MQARPVRTLAGAPRRVSAFSRQRICLPPPPTRLDPASPPPGWPAPLRPPIARNGTRWYGNVDPLPIAYAFRPRLRSRLTLSGRTFLRNPSASGGPDSHRPSRYSYRHSHFRPLHPGFRSGFAGSGTLPYHRQTFAWRSGASVAGFSPVHFRRRAARPVSYYALFQ